MRASVLRVSDFEILLEVGRTLNLSHAAESLLYSPPHLHQRIRAIEGALGVKLFVREGRGLALTTAGKAMLAEAHVVLDGIHRMEEMARDLRSERGETVVIGARYPTFNVLPALIARLEKLDSDVRIQVEVGDDSLSPLEIPRRVAAGALDIGFVTASVAAAGDEGAQGLTYTLWRKSNTTMVVAAEFYDQFMREMELDNRVTLLAAAGSPNATRLISAWRNRGIDAHVTDVGRLLSTATSFEALRQYALAGLGVALLPLLSVEHELRTGSLRIFPSPVEQTPYLIYMATRPGPLPSAVERVLRLLESMKDEAIPMPTTATSIPSSGPRLPSSSLL